MALTVNSKTIIAVADCKNLKEAQKADRNGDGFIDLNDAAAYYAGKRGGERIDDIDDIRKYVGAARHPLKQYAESEYRQAYSDYSFYHKGNFHVEGFGAGHVQTRHETHVDKDGNQRTSILFGIDCDQFPKEFLRDKVRSAHLIVGPKGFPPVKNMENLGEAAAVVLDPFVWNEETAHYVRGDCHYTLPEVKMLMADVDREGLKKLAGESGGVDFYVRVELDDGRIIAFNKDGVSGSNFELKTEEEFADPGQP